MLNNFFSKAYQFFTTSIGRDILHGQLPPLSSHPQAVAGDVRRVLEYINTPAYKAWDQEAWSQINSCMKTILNLNADERSVTIARGQLVASLDLLSVAEKARQKQKEYEDKSRKQPINVQTAKI